MTYNKLVVCVLMIITVISSGYAGTKTKKSPPVAGSSQKSVALKTQTTCPVMKGEIDRRYYVDYEGKRIFVCCPGCLGSVKQDPTKYLKELEKVGQQAEAVPDATSGQLSNKTTPKMPEHKANEMDSHHH